MVFYLLEKRKGIDQPSDYISFKGLCSFNFIHLPFDFAKQYCITCYAQNTTLYSHNIWQFCTICIVLQRVRAVKEHNINGWPTIKKKDLYSSAWEAVTWGLLCSPAPAQWREDCCHSREAGSQEECGQGLVLQSKTKTKENEVCCPRRNSLGKYSILAACESSSNQRWQIWAKR